MVSITNQSGSTSTYVNSYVADTAADIASLPTDCAAGSTCLVIETSAVYMLGSDNIWHEL